MQAAETNIHGMKAVFIFSYLMSLLPTGMNFRYFMWYLRSLQLVVHLPMFQVLMPANVMAYLEMVKPIVVFDYLPADKISDSIFSFDYSSQRNLNTGVLDQMEDLGYGSHNSILILGSLWIYAVIYLMKMVVWLCYNNRKKLKKWFNKTTCINKDKFSKNKFEGGTNDGSEHSTTK